MFEENRSQFDVFANRWWDPDGEFSVLARFNRLRVPMIRDGILQTTRYGDKTSTYTAAQPLKGVEILDVGCGGGLLSEVCARCCEAKLYWSLCF